MRKFSDEMIIEMQMYVRMHSVYVRIDDMKCVLMQRTWKAKVAKDHMKRETSIWISK